MCWVIFDFTHPPPTIIYAGAHDRADVKVRYTNHLHYLKPQVIITKIQWHLLKVYRISYRDLKNYELLSIIMNNYQNQIYSFIPMYKMCYDDDDMLTI